MASTILVVDDDDPTRAATERILKNAGYTVLTAANGDEAMPQMMTEPVDLILTDLKMPRSDGVDILLEVQKFRPDIPVLAMSAYGPKTAGNYLKIAEMVGARATLEKPFTKAQLLDAIQSLLPAKV